MHVVEEKRFEYWNHFVARWALEKVGGGDGVTATRLFKVRTAIMADDEFWFNVVACHGGLNWTPEQMRESDPPVYEHCLGNFWGMIYQTLFEIIFAPRER